MICSYILKIFGGGQEPPALGPPLNLPLHAYNLMQSHRLLWLATHKGASGPQKIKGEKVVKLKVVANRL